MPPLKTFPEACDLVYELIKSKITFNSPYHKLSFPEQVPLLSIYANLSGTFPVDSLLKSNTDLELEHSKKLESQIVPISPSQKKLWHSLNE